eukprot:4143027-Pyramimonas_sp.AAC.1
MQLTIAPCPTAGRSPVLHIVVILSPTVCLNVNTLFSLDSTPLYALLVPLYEQSAHEVHDLNSARVSS